MYRRKKEECDAPLKYGEQCSTVQYTLKIVCPHTVENALTYFRTQ